MVIPVRLSRLRQTVNKLQQFNRPQSNQNILELLKELSEETEKQKMTSLTVQEDDKLIFIKLEDISYFNVEDRYVKVHAKKRAFLTTESLTQLAQKLPVNFINVHRETIVNKAYAQDIQKYFNSRYVIRLNTPEKPKITTGRSYKDEIKAWINP